MGSSTTPPATRDAPTTRRASLSPAAVLAGKVVLGLAGLAGCVLLGAGGALLFKHLLGSGTAAVQVAPSTRTSASPVPPAVAAVRRAEPASSTQAADVLPAASSTALAETQPASVAALAQATPASAGALTDAAPASGHGDASVDVAAEAVPYEQLPPTSHGSAKPHHAAVADAGARTAQADKAACLARVNAITADLSLRSEPPTPQQLAILKRGCK